MGVVSFDHLDAFVPQTLKEVWPWVGWVHILSPLFSSSQRNSVS